MTFGEKIKKERLSRDMSLREFADLLGTSKQVLSRYEHDQFSPKISKAAEWARILNVSLDYFIEDSITDPHAEDSPTETADESLLLDLFRQIPDEQKRLVLSLVRAAVSK